MENFPSYKNVVTGEHIEECVLQSDQEPVEDIFWESRRNVKGLRIEEQKFGEHECPEIILSPEEETRILQPWKNGVIVKMLGRRIGYKALEAKLQQLWARKKHNQYCGSLARFLPCNLYLRIRSRICFTRRSLDDLRPLFDY